MTTHLLATAGDFGWGAAGKLELIVRELANIPVVAVGGDLSRALVANVPYTAHGVLDRAGLSDVIDQHEVRAALVVGSNDVARTLIDLDVPVVFVDSLPYLWTSGDAVPVDAHVYCAQLCPMLPRLAWPVLRRARSLRWVEAIVPPPRRSRGGAGAVLNVGGLLSEYDAAAAAYVSGVLPAVLAGLCDAGVPVAAVCGNLTAGQRELLAPLVGPDVHIGQLPHRGFELLLRRADLLVSSPGSTTLLQAHGAGLPVIMLPAQNVSQVLNAEWFGGESDQAAVDWPADVFDGRRLAELRHAGEPVAVQYLYDVVRTAADSAACADHVRSRTAELAVRVLAERPARPHLDLLGTRGAHQVAQITRQIFFAPTSRSGAAPRATTDHQYHRRTANG